ncbi:MAG: cupin domain-containing protein [Rhodospirillaceae bacterium]|jgi:quercetin dioxygenase-like cupin family protein|nr:cupin domain-containing protein [Rhodospirillaceae bacterium]MBT5195354.1 cupin domain-containing protein [Rhodospirillaceae bacterium]MBT5894408.1 cupin domain-containing protein [Rhodospirillaceae bacterium]MBT6427888.1 cupin domain-containing protein [Rhodospirillaceae bacterium]MBT7756611.1 cupin domain-containing protein [Rhodospirillaceae bacterium]
MPIIDVNDVAKQPFPGGATYQTVVGDDQGTTPIRLGLQISEPGYSTGTHSHPYMEVVTVIAGTGEAWVEGQEGVAPMHPGVTLILPANAKHGFRVTGTEQLKTYGVHASPDRIVDYFPGDDE